MSTTKGDLECMILDKSAEPRRIPFSLLAEITKGFSDELEIGRGGFAKVYKGELKNGYVAVKKLMNTYIYEKEFVRELECLTRVKHRNIVRFLGYCVDTQGNVGHYEGKFVMADIQERLLCFEYVPNGTLHDYIKDASCVQEWRKSYRIIKDICEGLLYLHKNKIWHLDLKPGNILLDKNMVAKITDFGLSRCFVEDVTKVTTTDVRGTIGYLAPEFTSKVVTHKFDLYSLGCIIMEMLIGKERYEDIEKVLESLNNMFGISEDNPMWKQIKECAKIGMECTELNPNQRPCSMEHIMDRLLKTEGAEVEREGDEVETDGNEGGKRQLPQSTKDGDVESELLPSVDAVIPKVRPHLRNVAGELLRPHTVPIGPYHQDAGDGLWTQDKKREWVVQDLERRRRGVFLSDLKKVVDGVQSRASRYYTDVHAMDSEKFCSMLLHDGCFLVSLFADIQSAQGTWSSSWRSVLLRDHTVMRDILYLLENQIPLFVIDEILKYFGEQRSALVWMSKPVQELLQEQRYISRTLRQTPSRCSHLVDLVYSYIAASHTNGQLEPTDLAGTSRPLISCTPGRWYRATEYCRYANIRFERRVFYGDKEMTILDVELRRGILRIPPLRLDKNTFTLLRNLMALEEHKDARPVTAYCLFMSQLACTAEDVELLRRAKVIDTFVSSDNSAAQEFVVLCDGVDLHMDSIEGNYLKPIRHDMERRCGVWAHNYVGLLRYHFFRNVLYTFVFLCGLIMFNCLLILTIYSVISYFKANEPTT